ncbi:MAG: hypothetical protein WCJ53_15305 [Mycobacteriaceae bacterium]
MEMLRNHLKTHAAQSDWGSYTQADYFRKELQRQIDQINEHARKCQTKLANNSRRGQTDQVRNLQAQLRSCAIERRKCLGMIAALTRRFPDRETVPSS